MLTPVRTHNPPVAGPDGPIRDRGEQWTEPQVRRAAIASSSVPMPVRSMPFPVVSEALTDSVSAVIQHFGDDEGPSPHEMGD